MYIFTKNTNMRPTFYVFAAIFALVAILEAVIEQGIASPLTYLGLAVASAAFARMLPSGKKGLVEKIEKTVWDSPLPAETVIAEPVVAAASAPAEVGIEGAPVHREESERSLIEIATTYSLMDVDRRYRGMYHDIMDFAVIGKTKKLSDVVTKVQHYGRRNTMTSMAFDYRDNNPTHGAVAFDFVEIGLRIPVMGYIKVEF